MHALNHGPLGVPFELSPGKLGCGFCWKNLRQLRDLFGSSSAVWRNDRHMIELPAVCMNLISVVGAVHQFIKMNNALGGQCHQRDGRLRVMYASTGQHRTDGHMPVGYVEVQLVPAPVLL